VILTNFFIIAMLHVVFNWQKMYKTVLEKAFFFFLWLSIFLMVLALKNLENGLLRKENILP
jgi:hypothetical protein